MNADSADHADCPERRRLGAGEMNGGAREPIEQRIDA